MSSSLITWRSRLRIESTRREILLGALLAAAATRGAAQDSYGAAANVARSCRLPMPAGVDAASWSGWLAKHDREIRDRLKRGEEDTLVNFLLFGVSFTKQARVSLATPDQDLIDARVRDFIAAVERPGHNERLTLLRALIAGKNNTEWIRDRVAGYLEQQKQYARTLDKAPPSDPINAHLFQNRGLSVDTNFRPDYAIEVALGALQRRGTLKQVTRAAVIGPGLDFTDKDRGFDYYPLQTLQPFALIDSLLRLGLASLPELRVSVFDISPLTLGHLREAANQPYTIQLVLDKARPWTREALAYWQRFGDRIGSPVNPLPAPAQISEVERRAIRVPREVVDALAPKDLNIVTGHDASRYDLIIGTNVFVYYDAFDQSLAMLNIAGMLKPGGVLLSNTMLPECPALPLHMTESEDVRYSEIPGDDDAIEFYSNSRLPRRLAPQF